jgi:type IX secretion system PorP/SprF family membrane protein
MRTLAQGRRAGTGAILALLLVSATGRLHAQVDPHFTQYYVYPSWLNPALTGAFDGSYRVSGIYRKQWGNVSVPYTTPGLSADFTTSKNLNVGASLLTQTAGDGGYSYTTAYGNFAYTGVRFGPNEYKRLVFGMQFGLIQRRFDPNKLSFGDQWNPILGYSAANPTTDILNARSNSSFDAGAGVLYFDAQPGKKTNLFAGVSAAHITRPNDNFRSYGSAKLPMRVTMHAGVRINVNDRTTVVPNALWMMQGSARETMLGAYLQSRLSTATDFMVGANYRFNDAASPFVGFTVNNMMLSASYDITTSDLGRIVKGTNSFEISLTIIGRRTAKTPEIDFVCPRL